MQTRDHRLPKQAATARGPPPDWEVALVNFTNTDVVRSSTSTTSLTRRKRRANIKPDGGHWVNVSCSLYWYLSNKALFNWVAASFNLTAASFNSTAASFNLTASSFNLTAASYNLTAASFSLTATSFNLTAASFNLNAASFNLTAASFN